MIWTTPEQVIQIHARIIQRTGGTDGIRDLHGLSSAIGAPLQTFGGEDLFPSVPEKIARLGYGLAANHAFVDGNKRIGAMMTQLLLQWNGYDLVLRSGELAEMFISIADGTSTFEELHQWILEHIR